MDLAEIVLTDGQEIAERRAIPAELLREELERLNEIAAHAADGTWWWVEERIAARGE